MGCGVLLLILVKILIRKGLTIKLVFCGADRKSVYSFVKIIHVTKSPRHLVRLNFAVIKKKDRKSEKVLEIRMASHCMSFLHAPTRA